MPSNSCFNCSRIIELIAVNGLQSVDLGLIGNESLDYLSQILENPHKLVNIGFGEDPKDPWKAGKNKFQAVIRRSEYSKNILSVNLYPEEPIKHYDFISEICILCKKSRKLRLDERENEFKSTSLNPQHNRYYDPDNHALNAYKFSVKSYLTNVFGSLLEATQRGSHDLLLRLLAEKAGNAERRIDLQCVDDLRASVIELRTL